MDKSCGASTYQAAEVTRLHDIARGDLLSGKDELERVASKYNERRAES